MDANEEIRLGALDSIADGDERSNDDSKGEDLRDSLLCSFGIRLLILLDELCANEMEEADQHCTEGSGRMGMEAYGGDEIVEIELRTRRKERTSAFERVEREREK